MIRALLLATLLAASSLAAGADDLDSKLTDLSNRLPSFKSRIDNLRQHQQDVSYPLVSYTVLENFIPLMRGDLEISVPNGWGWTAVNGNESEMPPVRDAHAGHWAIRIASRSGFAPNVYGLGEGQSFHVKPKTQYTFSVWAKCDDPGKFSFSLNQNWSDRLSITSTDGQWKRFEKTFTSDADAWTPRILVEDKTPGVTIDDLCLVQGAQPESGKNLIPNGSFEDSWNAERIKRELPDLERMADRLDHELTRAESGEALPAVPRWNGNHRPSIHGATFIDQTGRPIYFVGYGHFQQARHDIEKFPAYGINIIQCGEWGPSAVYPAENKFDDTMIRRTSEELDRAAKAGVAVDLLISPHYFPNWLLEKYPDARKARADFFPYSIYHPKVRELLQQFCKDALPPLKDKPALLSICLSNEPINCQDPDTYSTKSWHDWLAKKHGDVATLNRCWKSNFKSFDEIEQPNALHRSKEKRPSGEWMDFIRWNQESFTDFHKMLADAVHAVAPEVPVHIKDTTWHKYRSEDVQSGNDATLYGEITQINGNDSVNLYGYDTAPSSPPERSNDLFAQGWRENALAYDLQRSAHDVPVFNSENHPIFDRETRYIPPEHIRACLWQGAIHGQGATTIWVWEHEKSNPKSDFAGSIMERPGCAEAVGIVNCDLNRLAPQVAAIANAKPDVLILQSFTSATWDARAYDAALMNLYTALSFTGLKIGFITERQLESTADLPHAPVLFIPGVVHLSDAALTGLKRFTGKLVSVATEAPLSRNEYDDPRSSTPDIEHFSTKPEPHWKDLWTQLLPWLTQHHISPLVQITDQNRAAVWGVEWRCAKSTAGTLVNLYNARRDPVTIHLSANAQDLIHNTPLNSPTLILSPLEVRLLLVPDVARATRP